MNNFNASGAYEYASEYFCEIFNRNEARVSQQVNECDALFGIDQSTKPELLEIGAISGSTPGGLKSTPSRSNNSPPNFCTTPSRNINLPPWPLPLNLSELTSPKSPILASINNFAR